MRAVYRSVGSFLSSARVQLDIGWLLLDTSMTYFHISVFFFRGWRTVDSNEREILERSSLQISLQNKKEASQAPLLTSECVSPQCVALWCLRSAFTSSNRENNELWSKGEFTGHYCVAL